MMFMMAAATALLLPGLVASLHAQVPAAFPPGGRVWKPVLGDWSKPVVVADAPWEGRSVRVLCVP